MRQNKLLIIFFIWLSAVLLRAFFYSEINQALWIMALFLDAGLIGGGLFYIIAAILGVRRRHIKWFGFVTIIIVAVISYVFIFTNTVPEIGLYSRFWRNESAYMRQVQTIMAAKSKEERDKFQYPIVIDEGPPVRVAFSWGGIIDNWHGIVYDPTGEVLKASQFKGDWSNWNDPALANVKSLFGGDMKSAWHIRGPWYYCTFT